MLLEASHHQCLLSVSAPRQAIWGWRRNRATVLELYPSAQHTPIASQSGLLVNVTRTFESEILGRRLVQTPESNGILTRGNPSSVLHTS